MRRGTHCGFGAGGVTSALGTDTTGATTSGAARGRSPLGPGDCADAKTSAGGSAADAGVRSSAEWYSSELSPDACGTEKQR